MLDEDSPDLTTEANPAESVPAPRRRRAASRPAGPPAGPVLAETATAEPLLTEIATAEPSEPTHTEPPQAEAEPAAEGVGVDGPAAESAEPAEPKPARVRRTRKPAVADSAESEPERPRRSRRPSTAADATGEDAVVESLQALAREGRPSSRRRAGDPIALEAAQALQELAAAIGGQTELPSASASQIELPSAEAAAPLPEVTGDELETPVEAEALTGEPEGEASAGAPEETEGVVLESEQVTPQDVQADPWAEGADDADEAEDEDADDDGPADETGGDTTRRRRRRRGGRRRRRGTSTEAADTADSAADDEDVVEEAEAPEGTEPAAEDEATDGTARRRRRRRRRGEDTAGAEDDPTDVVVRVREPRRTRVVPASDEVTGIDGSTRMEAKRQRRREGRAAGRRRAPILSEAEFLARRESVDRKMLIRQLDDYTQIGVLEDGILVEHYVDRASATSMIGNIYLGRVQNVLPSMEAAFIDIGRGRNAVLYAGEVDWDAFGVTGAERKVEKVLKSGQSVLVQVSKDPIGAKGARLTSHVSLPGRYVVYSPSGQLSGISRKLSEAERVRLKGILEGLIDDKASVIVRTAAEGATEEELIRDVNRLKAQWEVIEKRVKAGKSPELLYAEPDLTVRIVRDLFTEDFSSLVVDGNGQGEDAFETVQGYVTHVAAHLKERLVHWNRQVSGDLFAAHRLDEQIAKALERKVFLPSGGSLIIDRTEAMTVIDVNTGRFTGTSGNLEMTVTSNNLEAAEEIVRQLRLRDIGGIIVIDFIDMVLPSNRDLLLRRLVECLGRDRTRHQVAEVTSLGLVQMTRKKIGTGLAEAFTVICESCKGRGYHRHDAPVETQAQADGGDRDGARRRR